MHNIVSPLSGIRSPFGGRADLYKESGFRPEFVADFGGEYYRANLARSTFADTLTFSRASSATMVDSTGTLVTVGVDEPRIGHHIWDGSAWVNEGYLHESEARTNLLKDTIDMSTAEWVTQSATLSYSDGWTDVDEGVATGTHSILSAGTNRPVADGTSTYTYAVDIEYVDRQHVVVCFEASGNGLSATIDLVGKTITRSGAEGVGWTFASATIEDLGADVVRVSVSGVPANTGMVTLVYGATSSSSVRSESYTGTNKKWRVRYAQLEAGSTPSSYIPTNGSTATRAAETLTAPSANLPWGSAVSIQMEGTMTYADEDQPQQVTPYYWFLNSSNYIFTRVLTLSSLTGRFDFLQEESGVIDIVNASNTKSPGINVPFNIASRHGSTFINGAVDGTALTANLTPVALPDLSSTDMEIGYDFMGTIKTLRIWADDIGDTGIAGSSS